MRTSLLVKAADPKTETEGLRPGFSPTHHPYIFVDCIKIQLEKQWDNCNCILIQRWGGDRSRGYYRLRDLSGLLIFPIIPFACRFDLRLVPPREENFLGIIFNSFLGYKTNSFIFRFEIAAQQIRAFFPLARQIRASFAVAQQIRAVAGVFFCSPTD